MRDVEPPREQLDERVLRRLRRRDARRTSPISETPTVPRVEPAGVRADDVRSMPPAPALEDLAARVDEEVVADVVPAVSLHVVDLDAAHDRRRARRTSTRSSSRCGGRPRASAPARSSELRARIDSSACQPARVMIVGDAGELRASRRRRGGGLHRRYSRTASRCPRLRTWIASAGPVQTARPLRHRRRGPAVVVRGLPRLQRPREAARAEPRHARAPPVHADEVEARRAPRRACARRRAAARRARPCARAWAACATPAARTRQRLQAEDASHEPDPFVTVPERSCSGKLAAGILTTVKRALLLACSPPWSRRPGGGGRDGKVLAVQFDARREPGHAGLAERPHRRRATSYDAAVILLDTPGGLEDSMRKIVQSELASKDAGRRLRLAAGRAGGVGGRLDRPGRRRARDGAEHEHRLVDADQRSAARTSAATSGARSINDAAASLRALARSHGRNARLGRPRRPRGVEPRRRRGAEAERHRPASRPTCRRCSNDIDGYEDEPRRLDAAHRRRPSYEVSWASSRACSTRSSTRTCISLLFLAGIAGIVVRGLPPGSRAARGARRGLRCSRRCSASRCSRQLGRLSR